MVNTSNIPNVANQKVKVGLIRPAETIDLSNSVCEMGVHGIRTAAFLLKRYGGRS
jgi:hypothetical protein